MGSGLVDHSELTIMRFWVMNCSKRVTDALAEEERLSKLCSGRPDDPATLSEWTGARREVESASREYEEAVERYRRLTAV